LVPPSSQALPGIQDPTAGADGPLHRRFPLRESKLIIEADGGQHAERTEQDVLRTRWLEARGYRVIRYWNNEVMQNLAGVLETILGALNEK